MTNEFLNTVKLTDLHKWSKRAAKCGDFVAANTLFAHLCKKVLQDPIGAWERDQIRFRLVLNGETSRTVWVDSEIWYRMPDLEDYFDLVQIARGEDDGDVITIPAPKLKQWVRRAILQVYDRGGSVDVEERDPNGRGGGIQYFPETLQGRVDLAKLGLPATSELFDYERDAECERNAGHGSRILVPDREVDMAAWKSGAYGRTLVPVVVCS